MINKTILIFSALSVTGCTSNKDYQYPIAVPPPPNVIPPNKAPNFTPIPQPSFIPYMPYHIAQRKQENERKVLTFIVK
jgi:hypothetical protein